MTPIIFNFFDYLKNPIADFCVSKYKSKEIYTLDDLLPEIEKIPHSKWALENEMYSYIGDALRLKLASERDNFFYVDADVYLPDLTIIEKNKNCTDYIPSMGIINNGTFFYSDKNCEFNQYYLDLYNRIPENEYKMCNYSLFQKYPFKLDIINKKSGDMNLLDSVKNRHFLLNLFYRFKKAYPNIDTIYYTKNKEIEEGFVWQIEKCPKYVGAIILKKSCTWCFDTLCDFIPQDDMIRLFKEQMNYTYGRTLKFVEI